MSGLILFAVSTALLTAHLRRQPAHAFSRKPNRSRYFNFGIAGHALAVENKNMKFKLTYLK